MAGYPGRQGRKPKPTALKALAGNPGKRKLNKDEPEFKAIRSVKPPEWLDDIAATMWVMITKQLCGAGVLQVTDLHNVEAFCASYSRWRQAEAACAQYGVLIASDSGGYTKNPAYTAAAESLRQMAQFGSLLGLDPSSRSRLIGGGNKKKPDNPFTNL